ncbi:hypothetical protein AB0925_38230 [Streptomyces griseofuscus]
MGRVHSHRCGPPARANGNRNRRRTPAFPCRRALLTSERFRQLWARHEVRTAHDVTFRIRHPQVGPLELLVQEFHVPGPLQLEALLLHAAPGSPSAHALALLATLNDSEC